MQQPYQLPSGIPLYGRDTTLVYYDVTNYYFETDKTEHKYSITKK